LIPSLDIVHCRQTIVINEIIDLFTHQFEFFLGWYRAKSAHQIKFLSQLFFLLHLFPKEVLLEACIKLFIQLDTIRQRAIFKPTHKSIF